MRFLIDIILFGVQQLWGTIGWLHNTEWLLEPSYDRLVKILKVFRTGSEGSGLLSSTLVCSVYWVALGTILWKQYSLSKISGTTILIKLSGNITTLLIYNLVMLSAPYAFSSSPFGLLETNTILRFQEPQTLSPSTNTHYTPSHSSHCWGLGEPTNEWCSSRVRWNKFQNSYSFKWSQRKKVIACLLYLGSYVASCICFQRCWMKMCINYKERVVDYGYIMCC